MKSLFLKLLVFIAFQLLCINLSAQKNDSSASLPKTPPVKEDVITAKKRKFTYFISDRISDEDKYDIFKITPQPQPLGITIVRGHLEVAENPKEKHAKITIYNASNNELVGIYNTNSYTGNYLLVLVPNVKYIAKVEVSGYGTTQEIIEVPLKVDYEVCRQDLKLKLNEKQKPVLTITSFFADENEKVFYLKSNLDASNSGDDNLSLVSDEEKNKIAKKNGKPYSTIDEMVKKQLDEEKKKPGEALAAFKSNNFQQAVFIYADILKNDPADPFINYYYGVCLVKLDVTKAKAINSLQIASKVKEIPYDVFFYLGKACHLSYLFNDAIVALEEYKKRAKPTEIESNHVAQLIANCKSGAALLTDQVNIEIIKRTSIQEENILAAYNPDLINDKVRIKTDFFNSSIDKKKQEKLLMCNTNKREYIQVSYGEKGQSLDLYKNTYDPTGKLGSAQFLGLDINTPYDENYPYLTPDGKTLYFSSKGHNSMGGYDIFKCTRADSAAPWSKPVNVGYPINSTYDDVLFIPDTVHQLAAYSSNRKNNRYEYIEVKMPQRVASSSIIKGSFTTTDSIPNRDAIISVYNTNTGEIAGVYKTNSSTGQYLMVLTSGQQYDVTIEADGHKEFTSSFDVPDKKGDFVLKQMIKLRKDSASIIKNYFTEEEAMRAVFDTGIKKANQIEIAKEKAKADHELKKDIKAKKPARTPEEAQKDQEDLKQAKGLYDNSTYQLAALLYQEIEGRIDLDASSSYYYGISLYHSKKEKTTCIRLLEAAVGGKNTPNDVFYYLGKANNMSYKFTSAISWYKKFETVCKPADIEKLNIEKEIEYCNNGIKLVNNPTVMEVYEKKPVSLNAIQNSITHIESGGKVLVVTDDMRSSVDKKKNFTSLLFLSADKNTVLYASYGENDANGKDIYQLKKLGNGKWTPPLNISTINSSLDEEYPSLSKDGKTLYFSSKGFENMGGYDIFKSVWNDDTQTWGAPINLGAPINSPFEDIYFLE
ncbi:MAG: hypothetical protein ABI388_04740 [Bacteroidia bacterium]